MAMLQRCYHLKYIEHRRILAQPEIIEEKYLKRMKIVREQKRTEKLGKRRQRAIAKRIRLENLLKAKERKLREDKWQRICDRMELEYFDRANKTEEMALVKQAWKDKQDVYSKFRRQQELCKTLTTKQEREEVLQNRDSLNRMEVDTSHKVDETLTTKQEREVLRNRDSLNRIKVDKTAVATKNESQRYRSHKKFIPTDQISRPGTKVPYGINPKNVMNRANKFIEVGKPARALETLYEVFRNKKWAYNWSESILEPIMFKYLDLCVELKKSHIAKEGLFQYRNMFQTMNVGSLENVIRGYLKSAEERTESAREHLHQAGHDIGDLCMSATPESILSSAMNGEDDQDLDDFTDLKAWMRFLWESYCQCLELTRTKTWVETLYHDIARMAYQFCLKYNRKTEFRKLCDKLRKHLENIVKLLPQANIVSLTRPETQQYNLETRLIQLDYAIQMELWQEAYKATEDIHNLMTMSKKPPVPEMMVDYYQKLAVVFWETSPNCHIFHATALFKLFQLNQKMNDIAQEDLRRMASRVLLATLSLPFSSAHPEFGCLIKTDQSASEKAEKLSVLLNLNQLPTRSSLLKDLIRYDVLNMASPALQELYNLLKVDFSPLQLCARVDRIIEVLQDFDQYIPSLRDVTLVNLIRQVSQIYKTITYPRLVQLSHFATQFHMERLLVECVRQNDMQIRIDHGKESIYFGADLSEFNREDNLNGVGIQSIPSKQIRSQLTNMNSILNRCLQVINPNFFENDRESIRMVMVQRYHYIQRNEHQLILTRRKIVEEKYLKRMEISREQEAKKIEEIARQQAIDEQKRLEIKRGKRRRERQQKELQRNESHAISPLTQEQKLPKKSQRNELKNLDADKIAARKAEELQKERKEEQQKLKQQEEKLDYFERAKRIEEIPLLHRTWEDEREVDRKFWLENDFNKIQILKQKREVDLQNRDRFKRMEADITAYWAETESQRYSTYKMKLEQFEKELNEIREERLKKTRGKKNRKEESGYHKKKANDNKRIINKQKNNNKKKELDRRNESAGKRVDGGR